MCDIEKKPPRKNEPWEPRGAKIQRGRYADCVKAAKRNHWSWLDNHLARPFPLPWQLLGSDGPLLVTKPNKMNCVYIITSLSLLVLKNGGT